MSPRLPNPSSSVASAVVVGSVRGQDQEPPINATVSVHGAGAGHVGSGEFVDSSSHGNVRIPKSRITCFSLLHHLSTCGGQHRLSPFQIVPISVLSTYLRTTDRAKAAQKVDHR
ncbi:hypothetical protein FALBO_9647 [Fusarium albosuccineum]|uniref:Uncharacterized protein n=1 Tax=Fusarium albosuccineum TaxID=1237068 RepID=A0A8H4L5X5_9HYPO|nr:hypothetical protein FALBO_9647 [Fusarium albosuccineum]